MDTEQHLPTEQTESSPSHTADQATKDPNTPKESITKPNYSADSEPFDESSLAHDHIKSESVFTEMGSNKFSARENLKTPQVPKKWEWLPCNYELKREEKGTETYWSLNPIIQLVNADSKTVPQTEINIDLERPFMYNNEVGWNWHKSWNLPNISINTKITEPKTKTPVLPPADLKVYLTSLYRANQSKAQLLAVKVLLNRVEQVKLFDLGLKGGNVQDLSEGACTFSGVKFSSTSYNNDGVKFHLVVLIYIQEDSRNRACPKILYSKISPPIFVDSRKAARNSHIFKNKKISSIFFDSFPPDTFTRIFVKRNNKLIDGKEEIIENSLSGLSQYFTAPNIRNKVKHPIFLASRFSNCVKLYYNSPLIKQVTGKENSTEEELIYTMQKVFLENHVNKKAKDEFTTPTNKAFDNKYFIMVIEEPNNADSFILNKKIADYLEPIINDVLHVIFNSNLLPSHFQPFPIDDIGTFYAAAYPQLADLRNSFGQIFEEANSDDYEDSRNSPTSKQRSDTSFRDDINIKRERSMSSSDSDDEDDDDQDEDSEVGGGAPHKKLKGPNKKVANNEPKTLKQKLPKVKESKKPAKKIPQPKAKKTALEKQVPAKEQPLSEISLDIKTENDLFGFKNEPESSSDPQGTSQQSTPDKLKKSALKGSQITAQAIGSLYNTPNDMTHLLPKNFVNMQQQQQPQNQQSQQPNNNLYMNMIYQNYGKPSSQENMNLPDQQVAHNNLAAMQQQQQQQNQQQLLQLQQQQQSKQQQQLWQLQQQIRYMHGKSGAEMDDKLGSNEFAIKMAQNEPNMNFAGQMQMNNSFKLQQQAVNPMPMMGQQYIGMMPGMPMSFVGNNMMNPGFIGGFQPNMYNTFQIANPMDTRMMGVNPYMNVMPDANMARNLNFANNTMYNLTKPE